MVGSQTRDITSRPLDWSHCGSVKDAGVLVGCWLQSKPGRIRASCARAGTEVPGSVDGVSCLSVRHADDQLIAVHSGLTSVKSGHRLDWASPLCALKISIMWLLNCRLLFEV